MWARRSWLTYRHSRYISRWHDLFIYLDVAPCRQTRFRVTPSVGAGKCGDLGGTELWPLRAVHGSAGSAGELYIAVPAGRTAR